MVVVDMMSRGPAAQQRMPEAPVVDREVADTVGDVAERDAAREHQGVGRRHPQRAQSDHRREHQRGHEERQRIVTPRLAVMGCVAARERLQRTVEYPAVHDVLHEAEYEQAGQEQ